jgi:hypothetical protein
VSREFPEKCKFFITEAVPKLQFLEQLLALGENCISRKCLTHKELAIFFKSLFQNQPGFGTSSTEAVPKFFSKQTGFGERPNIDRKKTPGYVIAPWGGPVSYP